MTAQSTSAGLSSAEALRRLRAHGPNRIVARGARWAPLTWLGRALADPMVVLLLAAAAVYAWIGSREDAVIAGVAVVPIAGVGLLLELRSERALERLRALVAPVARVRRDGRLVKLPAEQLVPGDVIAVEEGDVVPADARALESANLQLDESALTGESQPVEKARGDGVLAGSTVVAGRGTALVTSTGPQTRYGRIGTLVAGIRQPRTPLESLIRRLILRLAAVAAVFCAGVSGVELAEGHGWGAALIAGVSLAIAAVPEEFPMVYTLYLGLGAWRLAREQALVRRLSAVETLGAASVICVDKTGTLTQGRLELVELRAAPGVSDPELLEAAVLACEPKPYDPLEKAILAFASGRGLDVRGLHARELLRDHPFDQRRRYLSHLWRLPDGLRLAAKGSLEGILEVAAPESPGGWAADANAELARSGMRVLAVAAGAPVAPDGGREEHEASLRLLGLAAFSDPVRPGVVDAVRQCREAGIRVVMITGDHALTAAAVAEAIGLAEGHADVVTGTRLDHLDDAELERVAVHADVFARIRPEQKHRLVRAFRGLGHVVAMTGDGINDAPALREADIGVAMGRRGTEVAREAASLVLLDDDFTTIVAAVRNGRRIFANLESAFAYLVAFHLPLLLAAFLVPLLGLPLLLVPVHLVVLELAMHPAVSLVFEAEPEAPDTMRRPPRRLRSELLPGRTLARTALSGAFLFAAVLGLYGWRLASGEGEAAARSLAFTALVLGQLALLLGERARPHSLLTPARWLDRTTAVIAVFVLALALVMSYLAPLAAVLRLQPLGAGDWAAAAAAAAAVAAWSEASRPATSGRASRPRAPQARAAHS